MALQVLAPRTTLGQEGGLYGYRQVVYAFIFFVPLITACLAFINPSHAYQVAGPLCSLPLRPFWYRLALAWIPRYIIGITILVLTILMGIRVRKAQKAVMHFPNSQLPTTSTADEEIVSTTKTDRFSQIMEARVDQSAGAQANDPSSRKPSAAQRQSLIMAQVPAFSPNEHGNAGLDTFPPKSPSFSHAPSPIGSRRQSMDPSHLHASQPVNHNRRVSYAPSAALSVPNVDERRGSEQSVDGSMSVYSSIDYAMGKGEDRPQAANGVSLAEFLRSYENEHPPAETLAKSNRVSTLSLGDFARRNISVASRGLQSNKDFDLSAAAKLKQRHRYIQRQMQLLLVYPIMYLILWACPFALHCMQYDSYFAQHPPFVLGIFAVLCIEGFGFVNSIIFCLRERPWTMISDGDRTLLGSFKFWGGTTGKASQ